MIATIIITLIIAALAVMIIAGLIKDKKSGKSSCGAGCQSCAMHAQCQKTKK